MNKPIQSALAGILSLLLCTSMIACSNPITATGRLENTGTVATTGAFPALTTPSYYTPSTPNVDETYTPEYQLQLLANRDFDGAIFLIIQEEGLENAINPTADDFMEAYADRRNRLVQEKYNVELACIVMTRQEILDGLTTAKSRGEYFCDLLIVSPPLLSQLKEKSLLTPLDNLPFFETNSICIRQDATQEINSAWSGNYGIWGDALRQPSQARAVYYNRALAAEQNLPNLYNQVIEGKWDWQAFAQPSLAGKFTFDGDLDSLVFGSSGISSATEEGQALLADPALVSLIETLTSSRHLPQEDESALDAFLAGKSLFYIGKMGDLSRFTQCEMQVGLLPLPKYHSTAENYPYLIDQDNLPILACPVNVTSPEGTGIMLSALNAASCNEIQEIFLQNAETQVRDNGSTLMLPYCLGSLHFDRKLIYGK